jgi:hypothetical protein
MLELANIYADVEGLAAEHRNDREIWVYLSLVCHEQTLLQTREQSFLSVVAECERPGTVDVPYPITNERSALDILIGSSRITGTSPTYQTRVDLHNRKKVLRFPLPKGATCECLPQKKEYPRMRVRSRVLCVIKTEPK